MEDKVSGTITPRYIFIYVYMEGMSGMRGVRERVEEVKVKLKGTSRPSDKNPYSRIYIESIESSLFYLNFLRGFSTPIFCVDFLRGYFVLQPSPPFPYQDFLLQSLRVKQVLTK